MDAAMNRLVTVFMVVSSAIFVILGLLALAGGIYVIGGILVVAGGLDVVMTIRMRRAPKPTESTSRAIARPPLPPVDPVGITDPASLNAIPEPVTVCARCGFLAIRNSRTSGGSYAGGGALLSSCYCPRCKHEGLPLRFERRADYADFVRELHETRQLT